MKIYLPNHRDTHLATEDQSILDRFIRYNQDRPDIAFVDAPADADIVVLFEQFSFKQAPYAATLATSPLVQACADRLYTVNYDDTGQGFLPGCYTSLRTGNFDRRFHRACAYPKTYNECIPPETARQPCEPRYLFSFRGNVTSHPCRKRLHSLLKRHRRGKVLDVDQPFHSHDRAQKTDYIEDIRNSHFVLCPRGFSPSTYRLFEVMQLGRCPVIISDEWIPIEHVPWDSCSLRIAEADIGRMPSILEAHEAQSETLGMRAAEMWTKHFAEQAKYRSFLDMIATLHASHAQTRAEGGLDLKAQMKRWTSWSFFWSNRWTLPQKVGRRIRRIRDKHRGQTKG